MTGETPWSFIDNVVAIRFNDDESKLLKHKEITVKPSANGSLFKGKSKGQERLIPLNNYEKLKVIEVTPSDFVYKGQRFGAIQIEVERITGERIFVPWDAERISLKNPLKNIRSAHIADIINGRIRFGMTSKEVELAWGVPDKIRILDTFGSNDNSLDFIRDDNFPYGDQFKEYSTHNITGSKNLKGYYQDWYYSSRMLTGEKLVFDNNGILLENNQTTGIHPNKIHSPIALPAIK